MKKPKSKPVYLPQAVTGQEFAEIKKDAKRNGLSIHEYIDLARQYKKQVS